MDQDPIRIAAEKVINQWESYSRVYPCDVNRLETLVPFAPGIAWPCLFELREALQKGDKP
jgi:hypothetical protein